MTAPVPTPDRDRETRETREAEAREEIARQAPEWPIRIYELKPTPCPTCGGSGVAVGGDLRRPDHEDEDVCPDCERADPWDELNRCKTCGRDQ